MIESLYILPVFCITFLILMAIDFHCKRGVVYLSYMIFVLMWLLLAMIQNEFIPQKKSPDVLKVQIIKGGKRCHNQMTVSIVIISYALN